MKLRSCRCLGAGVYVRACVRRWLNLKPHQPTNQPTNHHAPSQEQNFKPKEQLTLEPYERDHAVVVGQYRPHKKSKK